MLALVIDTSSTAVLAAIVDVPVDAPVDVQGEVRVVAHRMTVGAHAHGELLAPSIAACLAELADAPVAVVAGTGPGPYTGLRVGLVSAAAFGRGRGIPAYGVCSLDGIGAGTAGSVLVAADARRREVYWARYLDGARVAGPGVAPPAEVAAALAADPPAAMAGAGARFYAEVLGLPLLDRDHPDPAALASLAAGRICTGAPGEVLVPAYLRAPDAVPPAAMAGRP